MKVLYFHHHFSTPQGATGTRSYENARTLVEQGHDVTIVCGTYKTGATGISGQYRRGRRQGTVVGINVIELELPYANQYGLIRRSIVFLRFAVRSIWIALTEDYDIVFATSTPLTAALPGIFARTIRRKPFVFEVRDLWPELPEAMGVIKNPVVLWMLDVLERTAYRTATSCVGLSPGIVEGIRKKSSPQQRVTLIPNGCDEEFYSLPQDGATNVDLRSKGSVVAIFTGAHGLANGLDAVLDAAGVLVNRQRFDIEIAFVGDGSEKARLVERAQQESLSNVSFHDPIPKIKLREMLLNVDIGLMILENLPAFYYGTSPNKFFDYIALGLPVLNNYPGWIAELVEKEQIGIVVPPKDADAFANALERLADMPVLRQQMGRRARDFAKRNFDRRVLSARFVRELEHALSK